MPIDLAYHVRTGRDLRSPQDMVTELRALGTEYVVVHGPASKEYYRDYLHPERLSALLSPVWHEGDDTVYQLPVRPLAHLVAPEELDRLEARIQAFDVDYGDVNDEEGFLREVQIAKQLGFNGKSLIHPRQVDLLHRAYAPTPKELEHARKVITTAEDARRKGFGVVSLDGKMIDPPVIAEAELVLSRAYVA